MARKKPVDHWEKTIRFRHLDSRDLLRELWDGTRKKELLNRGGRVERRTVGGHHLEPDFLPEFARVSYSKAAANRSVLELDTVLRVGARKGLNLSWSDTLIKRWCERSASYCRYLVQCSPMPGFMCREWVVEHEVEFRYRFGELDKALARVQDAAWWRRQVRKLKARKIDELMRRRGLVHASGQNYCSNEVVRLRRGQIARNTAILEGLEATNEEGQVYSLAELAALSTSNPFIRKSELMLRMRSFEDYANTVGHVCMFITLTAPSFFHPMTQIKHRGRLVRVVDNKNYGGASVRDAQAWLNKSWSQTRAAWKRAGIQAYGFRVVEPHADGCPHWHMALFFRNDRDELATALRELRRRMFREYAAEKGAYQHRIKVVFIDKEKGSATGYLAKYISKNIDGSHLENDLLGNEARSAAERIAAWASAHGIRQFQQIGGASVQVWRELRRLDVAEGLAESARECAHNNDWMGYVSLQGGVFVARADQPIRLGYWLETKVDYESGEESYIDKPITKYGEVSKGKIFGVINLGKAFLSRVYRWTIERVNKSVIDSFKKQRGQVVGHHLFGEFVELFSPASVGDDDYDLWLDFQRGAGYE